MTSRSGNSGCGSLAGRARPSHAGGMARADAAVARSGRAGADADGECRAGGGAGGAGTVPPVPDAGAGRAGQQRRRRLCRGAAACAGAAGRSPSRHLAPPRAGSDAARLRRAGADRAAPFARQRRRAAGPGDRRGVRRRPGARCGRPGRRDAARGAARGRGRCAERTSMAPPARCAATRRRRR